MKRNPTFHRYLPILLFLAVKLAAQTEIPHQKAGTTLFPFLDLGYDARSLGMGSADIGVKNDLSGVFSNPAALYRIDDRRGLITYKPVIMDIRSGSFAYGLPLKNNGVLAANLIYMSYGALDGVDINNQPTGETWKPYSVAGSVSYANRIFNSMGVGVALKGIYDRIGSDETYSSADGFALDAGWQYNMADIDLNYGIVIRNLGFVRSGYSEDSDDVRLPITVGTGISYRPTHVRELLIAFDLEKTVDDHLEYAVGGELELFDRVLMIRAGYAFSHRDLVEVFEFIRGETEKGEYQKTNWNTVSIGIGFDTQVGEADMNVDAALNFRSDRQPPSYAVTVQVGI
ncbi:MAG: PorV/PorQ family protein [Chitinispirillaceae bacterium]